MLGEQHELVNWSKVSDLALDLCCEDVHDVTGLHDIKGMPDLGKSF